MFCTILCSVRNEIGCVGKRHEKNGDFCETWTVLVEGSDVFDSFIFNIDNNQDQEHKSRRLL